MSISGNFSTPPIFGSFSNPIRVPLNLPIEITGPGGIAPEHRDKSEVVDHVQGAEEKTLPERKDKSQAITDKTSGDVVKLVADIQGQMDHPSSTAQETFEPEKAQRPTELAAVLKNPESPSVIEIKPTLKIKKDESVSKNKSVEEKPSLISHHQGFQNVAAFETDKYIDYLFTRKNNTSLFSRQTAFYNYQQQINSLSNKMFDR